VHLFARSSVLHKTKLSPPSGPTTRDKCWGRCKPNVNGMQWNVRESQAMSGIFFVSRS